MPGYSFTAPIVTEEQEQSEFESLTEEQREKLRLDAFGRDTAAIEETEVFLQNGRRLVLEALESLPVDEKQDYLEAMEQVPHLVETESDPVKFFRCEDYDIWAAAKRLAYNWKIRRRLFGDRAFLPMTLAGALANDVEFYDRGAVLFTVGKDAQGRPVNCLDHARTHTVPHDSIVRIMFYLLHVNAERETAQKQGYVALHRLKGYDLYKHTDRRFSKKVMMVVESAPVKAKITHMRLDSGRVVRDLVLPVLKHIMGKEHRLRLKFHSGSDTQVETDLKKYGLKEEHCRALLGGVSQNAEYIRHWISERRAVEEQAQGYKKKFGNALV